jgi:hypothetical protein
MTACPPTPHQEHKSAEVIKKKEAESFGSAKERKEKVAGIAAGPGAGGFWTYGYRPSPLYHRLL